MVERRDRENLKILEVNVANTAIRATAIAEWSNEFWLAIEVALHDSAPIRLEALRVTYSMNPPNPVTWVDGVSAFRAIEAALITNAVAIRAPVKAWAVAKLARQLQVRQRPLQNTPLLCGIAQ
jgi:hypothetical protein